MRTVEHTLDGPEANGPDGQTVVVLPQDRVQRKGNAGARNSPDEQEERSQQDLALVRRDLVR